MVKKIGPGHYKIGVAKAERNSAKKEIGVIRGDAANQAENSFSQVCGLKESKWFIYVIYKEGILRGLLSLENYFDSDKKEEAINYTQEEYKFEEGY